MIDFLSLLTGSEQSQEQETIRSLLFAESHDIYLAWLLCALTPWAKVKSPDEARTGSRLPPPAAALVAREGFKADNKTVDVVKAAVLHMDEIIASKNATSNRDDGLTFFQEAKSTVPQKRKSRNPSREELGMSIRRWGSTWRNSVVFAMLYEAILLENKSSR